MMIIAYIKIDNSGEMLKFAEWLKEDEGFHNLNSFGYPVANDIEDREYAILSSGKQTNPTNELPTIFSVRVRDRAKREAPMSMNDILLGAKPFWDVNHMPLSKMERSGSSRYDIWKEEAVSLDGWLAMGSQRDKFKY